MSFVKLSVDVLDSSVWAESSDTRCVWITMMCMANPEGIVAATAPAISHRARVSMDETIKALEIFESPDRWNKNPDHDGHRIERVEQGYLLVNYSEHRKRDHTNAARQKRFRDSKPNATIRSNANEPLRNALRNAPYESASVSESVVSKKEGESEREIQPKLPITPSTTKMSKGKESKDEKLREVVGAMKSVFDRVFDRTAPLQEKTIRKAVERLRSGEVLPWKLVALPIMVEAQGIKPEIRSRLNLSMLLRDGKHPRSHPTYGTVGATDWVYETYERSDKTRLDQRLSDLARAADKICPGLLSGLKRYNVSIMDPRVDDEAF